MSSKGPAIERDLQSSFKTIARDYDETRFGTPALSYFNQMETSLVLRLAGEIGGRRLLDVGSGTGRIAIPLAAAGARVIALDLTDAMTHIARRKAGEAGPITLSFCLGSARHLPFRPGTFDALTSVRMLHLIPKPQLREFLVEMSRMVKPGGTMIVEANNAFYGGFLALWRDLKNWRLARGGAGNRTYLWYPWEIRPLFEGLGPIEVHGVYLPVLWKIHRLSPAVARFIASLSSSFPFKYVAQNVVVRVRVPREGRA